MKKSEYIHVIESMDPRPGVKEEIWENINKEKSRRKKEAAWKYVAAALVVIGVATFSLPAVASGIRSLILHEMPFYEPMAEKIETGIYSKSDEHVQMTVEEILSDGMCVYLTVCYTALDEVGRAWLSEYELPAAQYESNLHLKPYVEDYRVSGTNYSWRTIEREELAQENERRFLLILETMSRDYDSGRGVLSYPMTDTLEETILKIDGNVTVVSCALTGKEPISELYQPTYIEISPMSYVVYAKNIGVYERSVHGDILTEKWLMPKEEMDALEEAFLIMEDGSRYPIRSVSTGATTSKETNQHSDLVLLSGMFSETGEDGKEKPSLIDPDSVVGIEIKGVYHKLEK